MCVCECLTLFIRLDDNDVFEVQSLIIVLAAAASFDRGDGDGGRRTLPGPVLLSVVQEDGEDDL